MSHLSGMLCAAVFVGLLSINPSKNNKAWNDDLGSKLCNVAYKVCENYETRYQVFAEVLKEVKNTKPVEYNTQMNEINDILQRANNALSFL